VEFETECTVLGDLESVVTGTLRVQALDTPGHTDHHLSYSVEPVGAPAGTGGYVCTGGSLLAGGSGRTDLLGEDLARPLARAQWSSVRRLLTTFDEHTVVLPTHGFGSFCSSTPAVDAGSGVVTIGLERERNPATRSDVEGFVRSVTAEPPPIPGHYRYMGARNRAGASEVGSAPVAVASAAALGHRLDGDGYVVDLRPRRDFAVRHRVGTLNIELGANLATYLGWILPYDAPFALVAAGTGEVEEARAFLARIGREEIAGWTPTSDLLSEPSGLGSYRVATFADLEQVASGSGFPDVLDVRHRSEWRSGHLRAARNLPLPDLADQRDSLPDNGPIWVHCAAGFRAAIAASMLAAVGRSPVLIDDLFAHAAAAGLDIEVADGSVTSTRR
jgi:rhodanese-related sulfurtransferase